MDKLDFTKAQFFFVSKNTIKKVKSQPITWEKIFADHVSDKGLISKIYKNYYNPTIKRQITQLKNRKTILNTYPKKLYK